MKRKRAVLFGGGRVGVDPKKVLMEGDAVICADSGYDHALRYGLRPDMVIGDMDSISSGIDKVKTMVYPVRKDFTDGELVLDYVLKQGFEELVLLGFTGTRMDHTITNIAMLRKAAFKGIPCVMIDENNEIYYMVKNLQVTGKKGDPISIVPLGGDLVGVTTQGLEYPLYHERLYYGQSRGVSNVMTGDICIIQAEHGEGIVTKSRD